MGAAEGRTNPTLYPPPPCSWPFRRASWRHPEPRALPRPRFPWAAEEAVAARPLPRAGRPRPLMNIQRAGRGGLC